MDESSVYQALRENQQNPQPLALATIVAIDGPSYRGLGTQIAVRRGAPVYGTISAGCLENDVRQQAERCFEDGRIRRLCYDATNEDELIWGMGTGCGGRIDIQITPLPAATQTKLLSWIEAIQERRARGAFLLEVCEDGAATAGLAWLSNDGLLAVAEAGTPPNEATVNAVGDQPQHGRARLVADGTRSWLVRPAAPPAMILLVGAGSDVGPLIDGFAALGRCVEVIDHRPAQRDPQRYPTAARLSDCSAQQFADRPAHRRDFQAAIIKNHHFERDAAWLAALLAEAIPYIGVLGPRARFDRLITHLAEQGTHFTPSQLARVYAPTGLDLGGENPAEVALSVIAEVQKESHARSGQPLREKKSSIHERSNGQPAGFATQI